MILLYNITILISGIIMALSLIPIRRLITHLPNAKLRYKWDILGALILLFITGYIVFLFSYWTDFNHDPDIVVPILFFFASIFLYQITSLSLQTTIDAKRISKLEHENIMDDLIGIHNFKYSNKRLIEEVERAKRYGHNLSIMLVDIDHFHVVNDTYGQQTGDEVLRQVGKLISKMIRDTDVVARFESKEILVITPHTPIAAILRLAERLGEAVTKLKMIPADEKNNENSFEVSISGGVAGIDEDIASAKLLVDKADDSLYEAKDTGRNKIVCHQLNEN